MNGKKEYGGKVLFLDRDDINTDEIIPAKYLTEISKSALGPHLLEDLNLPGFSRKAVLEGEYGAILTRANFGCGSSREHAPWALEAKGIHLVMAENFARIFRQNMYNCGLLALELPKETIQDLFNTFSGLAATVKVDFSENLLLFSAQHSNKKVPFSLSGFDKALIEAGGWVEFADSRY